MKGCLLQRYLYSENDFEFKINVLPLRHKFFL